MQLTQILFGSGTGLNPSIGPGGAAPPAEETAQSGGPPAISESSDSDNTDASTRGGGTGTTNGYAGPTATPPVPGGSNGDEATGNGLVISSRTDRSELQSTGLEIVQPDERSADEAQLIRTRAQARVDSQQQAMIESIGNAPKTIVLTPTEEDQSNHGTSELSAAAERGYAQIQQDQPQAEQRFEAWT
ncbi:hypothetical protein [Primorskyibacter flagellatus]|uniref:Uncharacterized protein n=1 Tax=Primorskyibacter flagellatus TaxID=1387277 RepID=A0A1W2BPD0_9RHOB|nr:hypothetical protein [Primorskyibacter flagellatus]SMC74819.1 hypothetical protein SAMN06295998_104232 [Primorskyibacter flagellatus]